MLEKIQFRPLTPDDLRAEHRPERGATATEYSLLVSFLVLVIVTGFIAFGDGLDALFTDLSGVVKLWPH